MIRMAIQVVLVDEAGDRRDVHEIVRIDRGRLCPEALGLSLEEAKAITGGIQQVLAGAQVAEWHADQRACPDCGRRRSLKGRHHIVFRTPFGALRLDSERLRTCPCAKRPAGSMSPLAELLRERVSPEMLYLETKFASLVSYGITLDERPSASNAPPDGPLFVGIDGGYVRGRDKDWFEVIAGKSLVSFHRDGRVPDPSGRCFAFVQTVDDQPRARLVDTLRQQGMQPQQQVVFLSDGADTLRRLQQNIAPEAEHVLDWFHVAMRLTVLGQMIKSARTAPQPRPRQPRWSGSNGCCGTAMLRMRSMTSNVWSTMSLPNWKTIPPRRLCGSSPPRSASLRRISPTTPATS